MGNIIEREKNREKAMQQIKSMVKADPVETVELEINKEISTNKNALSIVIPKKEETRSKRVNVLMKPSEHKLAQEKCDILGISLNECINQLISKWLNE